MKKIKILLCFLVLCFIVGIFVACNKSGNSFNQDEGNTIPSINIEQKGEDNTLENYFYFFLSDTASIDGLTDLKNNEVVEATCENEDNKTKLRICKEKDNDLYVEIYAYDPTGNEKNEIIIPETYTIKEKLTGKTIAINVRAIGSEAFKSNTGINKITLPNTIQYISSTLNTKSEENPFRYCENLTTIVVSGNNDCISSDDGILFNKDKTKIIACPRAKFKEGETYTIPDTVEEIAPYAFYGCKVTINFKGKEGYDEPILKEKKDETQKETADITEHSNLNYIIDRSPCQYTITYTGLNDMYNGECTDPDPKPTTHTYGTATAVGNPTRTGYDFVGWTVNGGEAKTKNLELGATAYTENITLTAIWTLRYTITYNLDGGTNNASNPDTYNELTPTITLQDPTKNCYAFVGWTVNGTGDPVKSLTLGKTKYTDKITLTANWTKSHKSDDLNDDCVCINCGERIHGIKNGKFCRHDNYIYFGTYPQTEVTIDSEIKSTLTSMSGTLPMRNNSQKWTSNKYYIDGSVSDFMWYIDLTYNNEKYRGVYFTSYRPYLTTYSSSASNSYQDNNGYYNSTVYWFKYEPIKWRILNYDAINAGTETEALLLAERIIDSQEYCHYTKNSEFLHNGGTGYPNNYELSNIRKWLNDTFYNTAFTELQKGIIQTTEVDNSAASTGYSTNSYACENTYDKVFLLSAQEVTNTAYGFNSDTARQKKNTDYAKCQGVLKRTDGNYSGNGDWRLRSPYYFIPYSARYVYSDGSADVLSNVNLTNYGVVPALKIRLS